MKIKGKQQQSKKPAAEQRAERLPKEGTPDEPAHGKVEGQEVSAVPKDYRRNDEEIRNDIEEQLARKTETAAENISVRVENGEVTLEGDVTQVETRTVAEYVAQSVLGAERVNNRLYVPGESG